MVAPAIVAALPTVLEIGGQLIDRLFPDPDTAAAHKIRLLELAQQGELAELANAVEKLRIEAEDRASARQREIQTGDSRTPRILAAIFTIGFFGVLSWLLVAGPPSSGHEALLVLLGALSAGQSAILAFYFGSSASSSAKNDTIRTLVEPKK